MNMLLTYRSFYTAQYGEGGGGESHGRGVRGVEGGGRRGEV